MGDLRPTLVTGAGGFIGSHLCRALADRGEPVRAFLHYNSRSSRGWLAEADPAGEIEAVCGDVAVALVQDQQKLLDGVTGALKAQPQEVLTRVGQVIDTIKSLEKELARLKSKLAASQGDDLAAQATDIAGAKVLAATLEGADVATLRETLDKLKDKLKSAAIVLASVSDGKVSLIAGVTDDLTGKVKAAILGESTLKSAEINVETFKGVVQLSGFVSSQAAISKAIEVARAVNGVKSVKNDMRIK